MHLQMIDILNSIEVYVYTQTSGGTSEPDPAKTKKVPVFFAARSRASKSQLNFQKYLNGPVISVEYKSLKRDPKRAARIHQGLASYYENPTIVDQVSGSDPGPFDDIVYQWDANPLEGYDIRRNPPVPVTLSYDVEILTQYQSEADQVLQSIVANLNPYLTISWKNPRSTNASSLWDKEIVTKVTWTGESSQAQNNVETDNEAVERTITTMAFEVETWIFPGIGPLPQALMMGYGEIVTGTGENFNIINPYTEDIRLQNEYFDGEGLQTVNVNIIPQCAVNNGAAWRFSTDIPGHWRLPNMPVFTKISKDMKIEFRPISDFQTPVPIAAKTGAIKVEYKGTCG